MLQNLTIFAIGLVSGLFGAAAVMYLSVFRRDRIRTVLGICLAIYAVYIAKDVFYMCEDVAADEFVYRLMLSIDNWAVPLYAIFAFELLRPGKMKWWHDALMVLSFPLLTLVYAIFPYDSVFRFQVLYAGTFSVVCIFIVLYRTLQFRKMLKANLSDITHMDVKWIWVSIALFLPNFILWTVVSSRLDYQLDAVYYLVLALSWGIVAYKMYFYKAPALSDIASESESVVEAGAPAAAPRHFIKKLESLNAEGYFVSQPHLTLVGLAAELGTNRTTLSNYFNKELGTTFYDYVNGNRLLCAEKLLADESVSCSVEEVAELSGFNSVSTFRRAFAKKHNMSPQQYRQMAMER
ncbi:MAG TPA: helix-turn-helix domain-containing protein [Candidatus Coprenecus stercoravium]|uniref:Helix-turn-helix domain-containing protein n=1 Tax=Candidatus Coprenecus stercoravium TaxID=2840735 RepID=A0A9D2K9J0_9BACT|nr:helix-turn-helix domain-containing protein [Candidatus Coprenecus stercoravium]